MGGELSPEKWISLASVVGIRTNNSTASRKSQIGAEGTKGEIASVPRAAKGIDLISHLHLDELVVAETGEALLSLPAQQPCEGALSGSFLACIEQVPPQVFEEQFPVPNAPAIVPSITTNARISRKATDRCAISLTTSYDNSIWT
jgi:hypothetical protein